MAKTYITTAIPYVNGNPHIGHAMDYLLADTYARFCRSQGDEVRFQVGTDEHGNKVFRKAAEAGLTPEAYADQNSAKFRNFIQRLKVTYTDFIRTTDPDHIRRCQAIWEKLRPHIYSAEYHGWYCEGCESFVTQKEYDEHHGVCPDHQQPYQCLSEQNYSLRISDFRDQIRAKILAGELTILPEFRAQEVLRLLDDAPDISISRPRKQLTWGVPVPGDDTQVMYVWIDALSNYLTILGYPDQPITDFWPAAAQFVGKDILRFHAITWPAILLGLGLPLPRRIVSHGHVLASGQKMSKSLGNVIDPVAVLDRHGLDAFRYFFLRHIDTFADSDFTWEKFEDAYNHELANDLGNLVQRLATLCQKNDISGQPAPHIAQPVSSTTSAPRSSSSAAPSPLTDSEYLDLMNHFEFSKALGRLWHEVQGLNQAIDAAKPWELAKQGNTAAVQQVLTDLVQRLLAVAVRLDPFLPDAAERITAIFTAPTITPPATPLYPKSA